MSRHRPRSPVTVPLRKDNIFGVEGHPRIGVKVKHSLGSCILAQDRKQLGNVKIEYCPHISKTFCIPDNRQIYEESLDLAKGINEQIKKAWRDINAVIENYENIRQEYKIEKANAERKKKLEERNKIELAYEY